VLLSRRSKRPVTRLRAAVTQDSYGDPAESWAQPARLPLKLAQIREVSSDETDGQVRRILTDERALFVPGAPDVVANDRIEVGDEIWRVDGDPIVREGLMSGVFTAATLKRVTGKAV
jgi:head-tail adaptor